jgi:hypothetical protein
VALCKELFVGRYIFDTRQRYSMAMTVAVAIEHVERGGRGSCIWIDSDALLAQAPQSEVTPLRLSTLPHIPVQPLGLVRLEVD